MLGRLAQQRLVEIDDLLGFVIEEVELGAGDAQVAQHLEELLPSLGRAQLVGVPPEPHADALLARVADDVAPLVHRPLAPDAFDDVMLEAELAGQAGELLHALDALRPAVDVPPDRAARLHPGGLDPVRERARDPGGGQRFGRMVLVANALRSRPIITTRHGVVISPVIAAALPSRLPSSRP